MARRLFGRREESPSLFSPLRRGCGSSTPSVATPSRAASETTPARKRRDLRRRTFFASALLSSRKNKLGETEEDAREETPCANADEVTEETLVTKKDYSRNVVEAQRLGLPVIPFTQQLSPTSTAAPADVVSPCQLASYPHEATFQDCLSASRPHRRRAGSLDRPPGPIREPSSVYLPMAKATPAVAAHKHCRSCTCQHSEEVLASSLPSLPPPTPTRPAREWPPSHQDYVRVERLRAMEMRLAGDDMQF